MWIGRFEIEVPRDRLVLDGKQHFDQAGNARSRLQVPDVRLHRPDQERVFAIATLTEDGRRINGFIQEKDDQVVVLKRPDGQLTVLEHDDIAAMKAVPVSIMPQGLLDDYTEQEVRDLFAYLRATQPLP